MTYFTPIVEERIKTIISEMGDMAKTIDNSQVIMREGLAKCRNRRERECLFFHLGVQSGCEITQAYYENEIKKLYVQKEN